MLFEFQNKANIKIIGFWLMHVGFALDSSDIHYRFVRYTFRFVSLQDVFKTCLEDVLKTNKCLLGSSITFVYESVTVKLITTIINNCHTQKYWFIWSLMFSWLYYSMEFLRFIINLFVYSLKFSSLMIAFLVKGSVSSELTVINKSIKNLRWHIQNSRKHPKRGAFQH